MTQGDIMKILDKLHESKWISTTELAKILKINRGSITSNLKKLKTYNEIESMRILPKGQNTGQKHRLTWKGRER